MDARRNLDDAASESRILSQALAKVARFWDLTNAELGAIVGISAPQASRLRAGTVALERGSKPFELGQYLVRLFRGLDALMGSDDAAARSWLRTANDALGGRPIDLLKTIRGLSDVADHVDAYRARV